MWFINRADAEALLARSERDPDFTYAVSPHGCGPGYGISVSNADGVITEAWDGESDLEIVVTERRAQITELQRRLPRPQ